VHIVIDYYKDRSLTSRCAISTFSEFQLLIMKYLVSNALQSLSSEKIPSVKLLCKLESKCEGMSE